MQYILGANVLNTFFSNKDIRFFIRKEYILFCHICSFESSRSDLINEVNNFNPDAQFKCYHLSHTKMSIQEDHIEFLKKALKKQNKSFDII